MIRRQTIVRLIPSPLNGVCHLENENGICGGRQKKVVQVLIRRGALANEGRGIRTPLKRAAAEEKFTYT